MLLFECTDHEISALSTLVFVLFGVQKRFPVFEMIQCGSYVIIFFYGGLHVWLGTR